MPEIPPLPETTILLVEVGSTARRSTPHELAVWRRKAVAVACPAIFRQFDLMTHGRRYETVPDL